jgi:integrase
VKITKRVVDGLVPDPERPRVTWDSQVPGFGVVVHPSGKRVYVARYRTLARKQRQLTLGPHGVLTPDQARALATQALADVRAGKDPAEERRSPQVPGLTVAELAARYLAEYARTRKKASSAAEDERLLAKHVLPAIGSRAVAEVVKADVARLHGDLHKTPAQANRILAVTAMLFEFAERVGLREEGTNPARRIPRFKEHPRKRYLSPAEMGRLGSALTELEAEGPEGASHAAILRLLLLTGCRRGEILDLKWREVDLDKGELNLEDSKTGARSVKLGPPAIQILSNVPRTGERVFHPRLGSASLIPEVYQSWHKTLKRAEIANLHRHDLRHTHASVGVGAGLSLYVVGGLLGHKVAATTQRYAHLSDDPLRQAADRVSGLIDSVLKGKPGAGAEVVPIRRGE